jgi:hypothetical protein
MEPTPELRSLGDRAGPRPAVALASRVCGMGQSFLGTADAAASSSSGCHSALDATHGDVPPTARTGVQRRTSFPPIHPLGSPVCMMSRYLHPAVVTAGFFKRRADTLLTRRHRSEAKQQRTLLFLSWGLLIANLVRGTRRHVLAQGLSAPLRRCKIDGSTRAGAVDLVPVQSRRPPPPRRLAHSFIKA